MQIRITIDGEPNDIEVLLKKILGKETITTITTDSTEPYTNKQTWGTYVSWNDTGVKKGGDNMRDDRTYITEPYMSRSPKGQIGE